MIIIEDGFYNNPDEVRNYALKQDFTVVGNYPGARTGPVSSDWSQRLREHFEFLLKKKITYWPEEYNTAFQYTTEDARTWIHHDNTEYAAVVYLTPDAPLDSGTALFQHNDSKIMRLESWHDTDYNDGTNLFKDWSPVVKCANVFNRAIIYPGSYYHCSYPEAGFGSNKFDGRLFQVFFFNTES
jgi:hypothetical protein